MSCVAVSCESVEQRCKNVYCVSRGTTPDPYLLNA
jgi:hypothetical protein